MVLFNNNQTSHPGACCYVLLHVHSVDICCGATAHISGHLPVAVYKEKRGGERGRERERARERERERRELGRAVRDVNQLVTHIENPSSSRSFTDIHLII